MIILNYFFFQISSFPLSKNLALQILQNFARCILARQKTFLKILSIYRKLRDINDPNKQAFYYIDLSTEQIKWDKPSIFLTRDIPFTNEIDWMNESESLKLSGKDVLKINSERERKRSPRVNRQQSHLNF